MVVRHPPLRSSPSHVDMFDIDTTNLKLALLERVHLTLQRVCFDILQNFQSFAVGRLVKFYRMSISLEELVASLEFLVSPRELGELCGNLRVKFVSL